MALCYKLNKIGQEMTEYTINGQAVDITVDDQTGTTTIVFPYFYPNGPAPTPYTVQIMPQVTVAVAEGIAEAILTNFGITG